MLTKQILYIYSCFAFYSVSYDLVDTALMKLRLTVVFGVHYFIRIPSLCYILHAEKG